jgi:hypothetical protein
MELTKHNMWAIEPKKNFWFHKYNKVPGAYETLNPGLDLGDKH